MITRPLTNSELEIAQPFPTKPSALTMAKRGENYKKMVECDNMIREIMEHTGSHTFWMEEHERNGEYDRALNRAKRIIRLMWLYARKAGQYQRYYDAYMEDFTNYLRQGYEFRSDE